MSDRGQAHTLEAIFAALILLIAITYSLQLAAVTPLSASTSSQFVENEIKSMSQGTLAVGAENGELRETILYWNVSEEKFHDSGDLGYYTGPPPETGFGETLERTLDNRSIAYNINLYYHDSDGSLERQQLVFRGDPSDHAVRATRTVELVDDDRLRFKNGTKQDVTVSEADFFAPDAGVIDGEKRPHYNLIKVEVVAWRL